MNSEIVAFLIPTTSKGKYWNKCEDSYLFKYTLSTLEKCNHSNKKFIFYIGFDNDDSFYTHKKNQDFFKKRFPLFIFRFIEFDSSIKKGHLTKMWNILYHSALTDSSYFINYFYQCGDDIVFKTPNWIEKSISELKSHNDLGISGPYNEHPHILTQTLISRKHYAIFNCLFPESIKNWGCDDWLNSVYKPYHVNPSVDEMAVNAGGLPRYDIQNLSESKSKMIANSIAEEDKKKIQQYLHKTTTKSSSSFVLRFH